jgi:hypothetical protein
MVTYSFLKGKTLQLQIPRYVRRILFRYAWQIHTKKLQLPSTWIRSTEWHQHIVTRSVTNYNEVINTQNLYACVGCSISDYHPHYHRDAMYVFKTTVNNTHCNIRYKKYLWNKKPISIENYCEAPAASLRKHSYLTNRSKINWTCIFTLNNLSIK